MGRLNRDSFAGAPAVMRVAEASALIRSRVPVLAGVETVPVAGADGRVLAADRRAPIDLPPFDNSAVDGYALAAADLSPDGETRLPVAGRIPAGVAPGPAARGHAVRIFTGAPMPPGTDTVAMQEDVRDEGGVLVLPSGLVPGANRRRAGEDVPRGRIALGAGTRLGPRHLALAAALGLSELPVRPRLRVAVFSTGDELAEPGRGLAPAAIHDANRPMLRAVLTRLGTDPADLGILRDAAGPLRERLAAAAAGHDLIVTSGGVSVGEEDHVRAAVEAEGALAFWRLAIKPGRPVALGVVAGTPFIGLPGNPAAAYVTALALLAPLVRHLSGAVGDAPVLTVRSGFRCGKRPGRREYVRVRLSVGADGHAEAVPAPGGALSGLAASDGLVELAEDLIAIVPGDALPYHPHGAFGD